MRLYDVHTHRPPADLTTPAVVSIDASEPFEPRPGGCYAVGIHPWHAAADRLPLLRLRAAHPQVVMIGEAGLDRLAEAPMSLQIELFEAQVRLADELRKPLIIHCVRAWGELLEVRKRLRPDSPWIVHGASRPWPRNSLTLASASPSASCTDPTPCGRLGTGADCSSKRTIVLLRSSKFTSALPENYTSPSNRWRMM